MMKPGKKIVSTVKGGKVARNAVTGRFVEVTSAGKNSRASTITASTLKEASRRRGSALKRLADR